MPNDQTQCKRGHEFTEGNTWLNNQGARVCRACRAIRTAEYRLRNPEEKKGHRNIRKTCCPQGHEYSEENTYVNRNKRHCKECAKIHHANLRWKKYGVTEEWYETTLVAQENNCAICAREFVSSPHIDHNHDTGKARGLLCYPCNSGLGQFQDNIQTLQNAITYLKKFSNIADTE